MSKHITAVNDANFATEVLESDQPVLVDFWAEWCGPCKALTPVLEDIANTYTNVKFVKLNIDESSETPAKYGIRAIPTLILFKNGEADSSKTGALTKAQLSAFLDENI
ncbi:MAG: thioredoxin [Gammaproteobacteria bacterium]